MVLTDHPDGHDVGRAEHRCDFRRGRDHFRGFLTAEKGCLKTMANGGASPFFHGNLVSVITLLINDGMSDVSTDEGNGPVSEIKKVGGREIGAAHVIDSDVRVLACMFVVNVNQDRRSVDFA